jgi:hypothetical protein
MSATILGTQPVGALGTVIGGPVLADGYTWWNINYDNAPDGWSGDDGLAKVTTPSPDTFGIGARVQTTTNLNVRNKANAKSGNILCVQPAGALGTIVKGPSTAQGYVWWSIDYDTSCDGWSAQDGYLTLVTQIALVPELSPTAVSSNLALSKDLRFGMNDPEVSKLQEFMQALGFFPRDTATTTYGGTLTKQAVATYQQAKNITPSQGYVGPTTRDMFAGVGAAR